MTIGKVPRDVVLERIESCMDAERPLIVVSAGSGLIATAARQAGAHLLAVYSSGRFRNAGRGSLAAMMPYGDSNSIVLGLLGEVLPLANEVPVLASVCATDPIRSMPSFLKDLQAMGVSGIQNFPSVGLIDGEFRAALESTGMGFEHEVSLVEIASGLGLFTAPFVTEPVAARAMVHAGADVLVAHLGVTSASQAVANADSLADAADRIHEIVTSVGETIPVWCHGGPLSTPRDLASLLELVDGVSGFVAGSSVERVPVEAAVTEVVKSFVGWDHGSGASSARSGSEEPLLLLDEETVGDYLVAKRIVLADEPIRIRPLGGGISNQVLRFETPLDCGVVKQARSKIRVAQEWRCDPRRVLTERDCTVLLAGRLPAGSVPTVRFSDDENFLFVMTCAPQGSLLWKEELLAGRVDQETARLAGHLLRRIHDMTRGDEAVRLRFDDEGLLRQTRIEPYYEATARKHPQLANLIMEGAHRLTSVKQTLVHGDFVPKNILRTDAGVMVVDQEIAHYGDPAYDVATCMNHLLLKAFAFPAYRVALLDSARTFWDSYRAGMEDDQQRTLERGSITHLGCLMLARVDGKSPVEYLPDRASEERVRTYARALLLKPPPTLASVMDGFAGGD